MADWNDQRTGVGFGTGMDSASVPSTVRDGGLRKYMLSIYNYMTSGVLLSAIVALVFANSPMFDAAYQVTATANGNVLQPTALGWIISLSPLGFMLFWWFGASRMGAGTLQVMFWGFATAMGLSLATILFTYTGASIALTFFATSAAFAGLSLFGYTTKKDLGPLGTFLIMGVVGLLVAMLLNILFFQSQTFDLVTSAIGVLIFAGLTAYDTQQLKNMYVHVRGTDQIQRVIIFGALKLYLDFINMFLFLLRFLGSRE